MAKAFDGRQGLELAESGSFDLVLLDIMLPGLNGLEVLRRLRRSSDMPVIMLTARDAVMDKVPGLTIISPSPLPSKSCWRESAWYSRRGAGRNRPESLR